MHPSLYSPRHTRQYVSITLGAFLNGRIINEKHRSGETVALKRYEKDACLQSEQEGRVSPCPASDGILH